MDEVQRFYHPMLELPGTCRVLLDICDIHLCVNVNYLKQSIHVSTVFYHMHKIEYSCSEYSSRADYIWKYPCSPTSEYSMNHVSPYPYPEKCYTTATERNAKMEPLCPFSLLLSLSHCSATFVMSLEMWCYEQSLNSKGCATWSLKIPKPLTSLQWHHVPPKFQHPKTMEHRALKLHCMTIVREDVSKNKL